MAICAIGMPTVSSTFPAGSTRISSPRAVKTSRQLALFPYFKNWHSLSLASVSPRIAPCFWRVVSRSVRRRSRSSATQAISKASVEPSLCARSKDKLALCGLPSLILPLQIRQLLLYRLYSSGNLAGGLGDFPLQDFGPGENVLADSLNLSFQGSAI